MELSVSWGEFLFGNNYQIPALSLYQYLAFILRLIEEHHEGSPEIRLLKHFEVWGLYKRIPLIDSSKVYPQN